MSGTVLAVISDTHVGSSTALAPLNEIDKLLQRGISVMVHTLKNGYQHWVLIVGKNGDDYIINDPWDGVRCSFRERYGDPARWIYRIRAYRMAA